MPFYTFETTDKNIKQKVFEIRLSFAEYDAVMAGEGPIHPETGKPCRKWKRSIKDAATVADSYSVPEESSRWDNFEYRAAHNLYKAQEERRRAEAHSHVGTSPYRDVEGVDLGQRDIEQFEGQIV